MTRIIIALDMVGVAQSVERRIVAPEVVGSIPIVHPMSVSFVVVREYIFDYRIELCTAYK